MEYTKYVPLLTRRYWQVSKVKPDGHQIWNHYIDFKEKKKAMNYIMANAEEIVNKTYVHYHYTFEEKDGSIWHLDYNW